LIDASEDIVVDFLFPLRCAIDKIDKFLMTVSVHSNVLQRFNPFSTENLFFLDIWTFGNL